jgi:WD40 repeat protein
MRTSLQGTDDLSFASNATDFTFREEAIVRRLRLDLGLAGRSLMSATAIAVWISSASCHLFAQSPASPSLAPPSAPTNLDPTSKSSALAPQSRGVDVIHFDPLPGSIERPVITAMTVSKDGRFIAAAGDDHAIRLVSLQDRRVLSIWTGHVDWVRSLAFSDDGRQIASCANDGWIRIWDTETMKPVSDARVPHALYALTFTDANTVYSVGFSNNVYRLDVPTRQISTDHTCDCNDLRAIVLSPNKKQLAYAGRDGVLRVQQFDGSAKNAWATSPVHFNRVRSIQFSDDSSTITTVGEDRRIVHFDVETKKVVGQTEVKGGKLMGLIPLSPDEFAVAGADNTIRIVGWNDSIPQTKLVGHDGSVCVLQRSNQFLISAGFDTTIRIWDLERAKTERDRDGRYLHPVAAQFEDSAASTPSSLISTPIK